MVTWMPLSRTSRDNTRFAAVINYWCARIVAFCAGVMIHMGVNWFSLLGSWPSEITGLSCFHVCMNRCGGRVVVRWNAGRISSRSFCFLFLLSFSRCFFFLCFSSHFFLLELTPTVSSVMSLRGVTFFFFSWSGSSGSTGWLRTCCGWWTRSNPVQPTCF